IRMAQGQVSAALETWNAVDRPRIDAIYQNFAPGFLHWTMPHALSFQEGEVLEYGDWRTSEARLLASRLYSNVGLEMEPSPEPDLYNAIVRTSSRLNTRN